MSYIARIMGILFASFVTTAPAKAAENVQRPVVLVAGILGSKLCTTAGEVVWGNSSSLKNFSRLELNGGKQRAAVVPQGDRL
jgi:hypothetical protein